jgi:hypothetical protein
MSELYVVTVTTGITSINYPNTASEYVWDTSYNRCPIDDSPGYACFEVPGGYRDNQHPFPPAN